MSAASTELNQIAWNKLNRILLSSRDFQQALSAATFLYEDMNEASGLVATRRLRCYETNMVVAYARPFSMAHGPIAKLKMSDLEVELTEHHQALHSRLIERRNRLYAHSDAEVVPMSVSVMNTIFGGDKPDFQFVMPHFDETCSFTDFEVRRVQELCGLLLHAALMRAQALGTEFTDRFPPIDIDARLAK
jgi:hypothetical protein